jgi:carboxylate-amine ligase
VNYIHTILNEGTSAERQLRVFQQTGDLRAVVQHVVAETRAGTMEPKTTSQAVN